MGVRRGVQRVTLTEAAQLLGISKAAVRQRARRGSLRSEKGDDGRVYVYVDTSTNDVHSHTVRSEGALVEELRDRIRYVERQIEEEREARRRADTLLARFAQTVTGIDGQLFQLTETVDSINEQLVETQQEAGVLSTFPDPNPGTAEQPFGLKAAGHVAAWLGGILSPLAISVLSAQDARYRAALVFAGIAVAGVFLVGTVFYAGLHARRNAALSAQLDRPRPVRRRRRVRFGEEAQSEPRAEAHESSRSIDGDDHQLDEYVRLSSLRWTRRQTLAAILALSVVTLSVLGWLAYLTWRVFFA